MSRSFHQSDNRYFLIESNSVKFKKNKTPINIGKIYWKKKKHIAYGEQRNFMINGKPTYAGEVFYGRVGEFIVPIINKRKARIHNKININSIIDENN